MNDKVYTEEEAKAKLAAFQVELNVLLESYGMHSVAGVVTVLQGTEHGSRWAGVLHGCNLCAAQSLARLVTRQFRKEDIDLFLRLLQTYMEERKLNDPDEQAAEALRAWPVASDKVH